MFQKLIVTTSIFAASLTSCKYISLSKPNFDSGKTASVSSDICTNVRTEIAKIIAIKLSRHPTILTTDSLYTSSFDTLTKYFEIQIRAIRGATEAAGRSKVVEQVSDCLKFDFGKVFEKNNKDFSTKFNFEGLDVKRQNAYLNALESGPLGGIPKDNLASHFLSYGIGAGILGFAHAALHVTQAEATQAALYNASAVLKLNTARVLSVSELLSAEAVPAIAGAPAAVVTLVSAASGGAAGWAIGCLINEAEAYAGYPMSRILTNSLQRVFEPSEKNRIEVDARSYAAKVLKFLIVTFEPEELRNLK